MRFPGWSTRACWSAPLVVTLLFCVERLAHAESSERSADEAANPNRQRAEALYKEGAVLLRDGRYWEAEVRFQDSLKLLKGRGTLLNLAICHENLGRLATAWREFKSLEEQARAAGDTTRQDVAREHLVWIEPQLWYLSVTLSAGAQVPGIQVELDGQSVSTFGVRFPVEAGSHRLRARAPGKKDWSLDLVSETGTQPRSVTIPSLVDVDVIQLVSPSQPQIPQRAAVAAVQRRPEPRSKADDSGVYIAGATTLTLTVGAVVSSFLYYDRRLAYHDAIAIPVSSEAEQSARRDSAERMAWINGTLIVSAGVGAAVTGILWYRASRGNTVRVAEGAWVTPLLVGSGAGLRAGASF